MGLMTVSETNPSETMALVHQSPQLHHLTPTIHHIPGGGNLISVTTATIVPLEVNLILAGTREGAIGSQDHLPGKTTSSSLRGCTSGMPHAL